MYEASARKASGYFVCSSPTGYMDGDTKQCVHCGTHWQVKKGSGVVRGFCGKCDGYHCGSPICSHECFPIEERMTLYEKGLLPDLMAPRERIGEKPKLIIL